MENPFVCPDCGVIYSNAYFLTLHLTNKCFHVYKTVNYKCQSCPGIKFTTSKFLEHIQEVHLHSMFRCSHCSLLFSNSEEFNNHMSKNHQKLKVCINFFFIYFFLCSHK